MLIWSEDLIDLPMNTHVNRKKLVLKITLKLTVSSRNERLMERLKELDRCNGAYRETTTQI